MTRSPTCTLPRTAGVGLKAEHYRDVLAASQLPGFFEIHAENYFCAGGPAHRYLEAIRSRAALSVHGVALSLGGLQRPAASHLQHLRELLARYEPESFSEHLAWCSHEGLYLNDLLPLPYTRDSLARVCAHIDETQTVLGRRLLLENPATYLRFEASEYPETDFLREVVRRTGCGLLLDVNNVQVCAVNHGFSAQAYLENFPLEAVGQIHLAGHAVQTDEHGHTLLIDAHDRAVDPAVWALLDRTLSRTGPLPVLIEWDNALPDWTRLAAEARLAGQHLHEAASADVTAA